MVLDGLDAASIERATVMLAAGELVAFPTETVYGLGARADDDRAVAAIFALKGRPAAHPLIVHIADRADADRFAATFPPVAHKLVEAFWPGCHGCVGYVPEVHSMRALARHALKIQKLGGIHVG